MCRNCFFLLPNNSQNKRLSFFLPFKNSQLVHVSEKKYSQLPRNISFSLSVCICAYVHMRICVQEFQSPSWFIGSSGIYSAMADLSHIEFYNLGRLQCPLLSCIQLALHFLWQFITAKAWHSPTPSLLLTHRNELITRKRDKNEI